MSKSEATMAPASPSTDPTAQVATAPQTAPTVDDFRAMNDVERAKALANLLSASEANPRDARKVKKSLVPSILVKIAKGDSNQTTADVRLSLLDTIAQAARCYLSLVPGEGGKVGTGVRLIGGGDTVEANQAALANYREGKI